MSSLSYYQQERDRIDEHIEEEKQKEVCEDAAKSIMTLYNAFIAAGMPEDKAWHFVEQMFHRTISKL